MSDADAAVSRAARFDRIIVSGARLRRQMQPASMTRITMPTPAPRPHAVRLWLFGPWCLARPANLNRSNS